MIPQQATMHEQTTMSIRLQGDPILIQKAKEVTAFDETLDELRQNMICTMYKANGIGLAGPQVGLSTRVLVVDLQRKPEDEGKVEFDGLSRSESSIFPLFVANPILEPVGGLMKSDKEGCLSIPNQIGDVERFVEVKVEFQDTKGDWHILRCDNLLARCFQHEIDHLEGILFVEKAKNIQIVDRNKSSASEAENVAASAEIAPSDVDKIVYST
jgi:peptide deformylase